MKRIDQVLLVSLIGTLAFTACKKPVGRLKGGDSAANSSSSNASGIASGDLNPSSEEAGLIMAAAENDAETIKALELESGGEPIVAAVAEGEQPAEERYNFAHWIKSRPKMSGIHKHVDEAATALTMGDKSKFALESNATFGMSPDNDPTVTDRNISGIFWIDLSAFNTPIHGDGETCGYFFETGANATLNQLGIDVWVRLLGQDIAARTVLAGFDQVITREKTMSVNYGPGSAEASLGGEIGLRTEFGARRDNVLNLIYAPRANVHAGAAAWLGVGIKTGVRGTIRLADLVMKGSASLGYLPDSKLVYYDFGLDQGEMKFIDGEINWVTAKVDLFGLDVEGPKIAIYNPEPVANVPTPVFSTAFMNFLQEPANCVSVTNSAAQALAGKIKTLEVYMAAAPEDDQVMVKANIARTGMVYKKVREKCKI